MKFARPAFIASLVSAFAVLVPAPALAQHDVHAGMYPRDLVHEAGAIPTPLALPHGIPDFCANSSANVPSGQTQTWTGSEVRDCVGVHGTLVLQGALSANVIMVYEDGFLDVQSGASITIRDRAVTDPEQFGTGLIVFGRVRMVGADKTPFVRTSVEPVAGATTFTLASAPSGWAAGDRVFVPDTRQVPPEFWFNSTYALQHEIRTIAAINGATVTFSQPLAFDHRGARDANGTPTVLTDGTKLLPHVANLTRSIVIRSENPDGTRGHTIYTERANVDIRNVRFEDLGRTTTERIEPGVNQIGRYPLHLHHLMGPTNPTNTGYQFTVIGNVIENSLKWPMAVHTSHFGLIEGNVVIGGPRFTGAGIAVEDGDETENLFRRNFVADIRGNQNPFSSAQDDAINGTAAECYWAKGFNNRFVDNVAAGCRNAVQQIVSGVGFKFLRRAAVATLYNPRFRGADHSNPADMIAVNPQRQPLLQFDGNEAYGLMAGGFTDWFLGTNGAELWDGQLPSTIRNFRVWHTYQIALYFYPSNRVTIDGLVYRIDGSQPNSPPAFDHGDYLNGEITIRNSNIHAGTVYAGRHPLKTWRFENNRVTTRGHAFSFVTPDTAGGGPVIQPRPGGVTFELVRNVVTAWPGRPLQTIEMSHDLSRVPNDTVNPFNVYVTDHQGVAGDSFRVCFAEQATQNIYGGTCSGSTRADIHGILSGAGPPPSPAPPTPGPPDPEPAPPGSSPIPPPAHDGNPPYCLGLTCLPIDGPMIRSEAAVTAGPTSSSTAGDYDGDGKADPTVFHASTGAWYTLTSRSGYGAAVTFSFGTAGDVPVPGDYNGDGKADAALYRPSAGTWLVTESRDGFMALRSFSFDAAADQIAVPADYDGDRRTDLVLFRPSTGTWSMRLSRSGFADVVVYRWGGDGDLAAAADFDGDGRADPAVYRPSTGTWLILTSTTTFVLGLEYRFGDGADVPVPGDYDGDGRADLATYNPVSGVWRVLTSGSGYADAFVRTVGSGDAAVAADDDGDGKTDFRVYRRATGEWLQWSSSAGFAAGRVIRQLVLPGAVAAGALPTPSPPQ